MNQWINKLNQIWNSTKDVDDNIDDLVKASIKRNAIHQARLENHFIDPWIKQFPKPPDMNHEIAIENRKPPYVGIIKKYDDGEIRCDHNNYGFRCEDIEEKTDDDLVIVSLGCSFTYGAGVHVEDRWSDVLCKKIQETTKLKVRNKPIDLGIRKSSFRKFLLILRKDKPIPCNAPHIINPQLAPCHKPPINIVMKRFLACDKKPNLLPPRGIYI